MDIQPLYQLFLKYPFICTDSRKIKENSIFFALKGENFDGNKFAKQTLKDGAIAAVVDDPNVIDKDGQYFLVNDVLEVLQALATHHRQRFHVPIIAITGSNGKTTTKELCAAVLDSHYNCHFTKGNFNNHIGVPLTLLEMPLDTEIAIIEMGANHLREIDFLCQIARPSHGLITNIGKAHLEGFGSLEGVKKGKSELYDFLSEQDGLAFVNLNENYLLDLSQSVKKKLIYTKSEQPDPTHIPYEIQEKASNPFLKVAFLDQKSSLIDINSQLIGAYNFNNIMTAIALGKYFKVPGKKIKAAIENYIPANNRSQLLSFEDNNYILDAYNANPDSMKVALEYFDRYDASDKIAILGDMLELGKYAKQEHDIIARFAKSLDLEQVILVGKHFKEVAGDHQILHFDDIQRLKKWFEEQNFKNKHILIKGSRGIQLEKLVK